MVNSYVFPHSTCEPPLRSHGWLVVQPASAAVTGATTLMLARYAHSARSSSVRAMLATFAAFQGLHMTDHLVHISPSLQAGTTHALGYFMYLTTLAVIVDLSPHQQLQLSRSGVALVLVAVMLDVWACATLGGIWMIGSGLGVFAAVVLSQWPSLPPHLKAELPTMLLGVGSLLLLFVNEASNCQGMLAWRRLPYHAAIELMGWWLFHRLATAALRWEAAVVVDGQQRASSQQQQQQQRCWYGPLLRSLMLTWELLVQHGRGGIKHAELTGLGKHNMV